MKTTNVLAKILKQDNDGQDVEVEHLGVVQAADRTCPDRRQQY